MSKPITEVIDQIDRLLVGESPQFLYDLDMLYEKAMATPPENMVDRWRELGFLIDSNLGDPGGDPHKKLIYDILMEGTKDD